MTRLPCRWRVAGCVAALTALCAPAEAATLALAEDSAFDQYAFAVGYHDIHDLPKAIAYYTKAIKMDPGFAKAYYGRGIARAQSDDLGGAIADLRWTIALDPRMTNAYLNRGHAFFDLGLWPEDSADYTEVIARAPAVTEAYRGRALARARAGDVAGALRDVEAALRRASPDVRGQLFDLQRDLRARLAPAPEPAS